MTKIPLLGAALLLGAIAPATAQGGGQPPPNAPTVGGSPSGTSTVVPQANGAAVPRGARPTPAAVKEMLEQQGYTSVTDVEEGDRGYTATATKDKREVRLAIDPEGKISERK